MKPLDFVKTPLGATAIITEINTGQYNKYSISYLGGGNPTGEKSAWWGDNEGLIVIDNLASLIARNVIHPFGNGLEPALNIYPII